MATPANEKCVMLGLYSFIRKSEARTQVSDTKLYPHLEAVLDSNVQVWAVKLRSLLERSVAKYYLMVKRLVYWNLFKG